MKKILFLFPHFFLPGGAANSTVRFARYLQHHGYIVEILCAGATSDFLQQNNDLKFKLVKIPPSNTLQYWALLLIWQFKINLVLSCYKDYIFFPQVLPSNWWAWLYKLNHKNQKIIWNCNEPSAFIHSVDWINAIKNPLMRLGAKLFRPILKLIDVYLEKQNDLVFGNSQFAAASYKTCYGKTTQGVIYPPSYIKDVAPALTKDNYFFTVSRLTKFKNVDLLINSFTKIAQRYPNYNLIIAGQGEYLNTLKKLTQNNKIEDRVTFLGSVSDDQLANLYIKARATVFCSKNEPFGLVPIESMMYGTPVVAYNNGGPKETIINGKTGFLFEADDMLTGFLERIIKLDDKSYQVMQHAAQLQAKKFDISISGVQLEKMIIAVE
ncbi:MAG: glycosyltransferase family 4 protein [Patescibacteria group bacterium]